MQDKLSTKKVTVGVVTYNNPPEELSRFYRSFQKSTESCQNAKVEFVSIDNGSPSWFKYEQRGLSLPTQGNVGFAKAVNHLMNFAFHSLNSDYVIISNPDGFFHYKTLSELVKSAQNFPDCLIEARAFPEEHPKAYDLQNGDTEWASGCCLLIPKNIFEKTQGFDENFFLYMEDVDFSWRTRQLGFGIKYCPKALYGHGLQGRSEGTISRRKHLLISGRYFAWKWGLSKYQRQCEEELLKDFGVKKSELPKLDRHRKEFAAIEPTKIPKFNAFFIFSPVRW